MSSYPSYSQQYGKLVDDCLFEHVLCQLQQECPTPEQVARALREANAAFASQCTDPDGYVFMATCDELIRFLDLRIALELPEQQLVVQVLQVALAMHENAVNNPVLTPDQRSVHYLATTALLPLCKCALEKAIMDPELWCHMFQLVSRAELSFTKAADKLDLSNYFDFENVQYDFFSSVEEANGVDQASAASSAAPSPTSSSTTSEPVKAETEAARDTTPDASSTARSGQLKEKALAMLNDGNESPSETAPLGRRHTAPTSLQTGSWTSAGRTSSEAHPCWSALQVLQEAE